MGEESNDWVLTAKSGGVFEIILNRPNQINAQDVGMIRDVRAALQRAENDEDVRVIVLRGNGERGFCAGGDVRSVTLDVMAGKLESAHTFFSEEYALNAYIDEYPKLIVALMHGVCMGGGVGLASHSSMRIVTDGSLVAMPETKIGFSPDAGGSWLLGRAPGRLGERLALHGQTMGPAEAIEARFADVYLPRAQFDSVVEVIRQAIANNADVRQAVAALGHDPGPADFGLARNLIDQLYSAETAEEIMSALRKDSPEDAHELERLSPTALEVSLRAVRAARTGTLRDALERELIVSEWLFTERTDTVEGIRALLIDKDKTPTWPPMARSFPI